MDLDDLSDWEHNSHGGKFWHHALAGASAGICEHLAMYPFDTIKTNIQAARPSECGPSGATACGSSVKVPGGVSTGSSVASSSTSSCASAGARTVACPRSTAGHSFSTVTPTAAMPMPGSSAARAGGFFSGLNMGSVLGAPNMGTVVGGPAGAASCSTAAASAIAPGTTTAPSSSAAAAEYSGTLNTFRAIRNEAGIRGLYRGVSAMAAGCVPAHIGYFCAYEVVRQRLSDLAAGGSASRLASLTAGPGGSSSSSSDSAGAFVRRRSSTKNKEKGEDHSTEVLSESSSAISRRDLSNSSSTTLLAADEVVSSPSSSSSSSSTSSPSFSSSNSSDKEQVVVPSSSQQSLSADTTWVIGSLAGAAGAFMHDLVLTPLDVAKQRMQLNSAHTKNCADCVRHVIRTEGYGALYRSFPVALLSNVPFSMIMVGTNETLKQAFNVNTVCQSREDFYTKLPVYLSLAGVSSGIAAVCTQPLDVIRTRIQTQSCLLSQASAAKASSLKTAASSNSIRYHGLVDGAARILREEGARAFFKGSVARVLTVVPSLSISWASYEAIKSFLVRNDF
ncbi:unnamed protein product [Amoebophrya sp. A25]|nr:unnamed protein product [Amoebophrya sp. A25]|eukprot:GSA25T00003694001.1